MNDHLDNLAEPAAELYGSIQESWINRKTSPFMKSALLKAFVNMGNPCIHHQSIAYEASQDNIQRMEYCTEHNGIHGKHLDLKAGKMAK